MLGTDSAVFLEDFGVSVSAKGRTGKGILDAPSEVIAGNMVISTDYALTVRTAQFGMLAYGDSIKVDGDAYTVREVRAQDDGTFSVVYLARV